MLTQLGGRAAGSVPGGWARRWGQVEAQPSLLGPQSVENCMCVLHNLSYRLDAEVPTRYRQLEYSARNAYTDKSSTGCFSNKSDRMMVRAVALAPPPHPPRLCPGSLRPAPREDPARSGEGLLSPTTQALCARGEGARAACWQAYPPFAPSFLMGVGSLAPMPPEPPGLPRSREMLGRRLAAFSGQAVRAGPCTTPAGRGVREASPCESRSVPTGGGGPAGQEHRRLCACRLCACRGGRGPGGGGSGHALLWEPRC